ncbi:uncharacterized protein LOC115563826 [Drosophila navojoa]|uniref:uncharacterized protein LOC115563826 n=1 Tax=Drosophila navojoa TaxID=7232 RepID=UPI0011BE1AD4|nr:uncharacterized protein LOC115563826 [Drosophila navojoa]
MLRHAWLWALLSLITVRGADVDNIPKILDKCRNRCQCWFRNGTSLELLSSANCLNFCADDHTKPCFDWVKCITKGDNCQVFCSSLAYNCIARDYVVKDANGSGNLKWLAYIGYALLGLLCVLGIIILVVKRKKFF